MKERLIEILKNRIVSGDRVSTWLLDQVQSIISQATNHLKYVTRVMPEFDIHDASHSEAVLKIIEDLLGTKAKKLQSFDIFYIIGSAYLHDCGMAISDYEMRIMELTEGTDKKYVNEESLKNDGKRCYTHAQAAEVIRINKDKIYQDFGEEIQNWIFIPATEKELIHYLASLLIEYQEFRNQNYSTINNSKDFASTNQSLRVEYIRRTHHKRIAEYIRRWGKTQFVKFPVSDIGQRIANDLAAICEAHGENPEYVGGLSARVEYCGEYSANLQCAAMLLRIGDIVHFDYDRAPLELRSLHQFESEYSFGQWRIKSGGVNHQISKGTIFFRAFISKPVDYYALYNYIDWIDNELRLFNQLSAKWNKDYCMPISEKVDRSNVTYDKTIFTPVLGLKFTLNQNRILELLKSVGLYKEKVACIRELYQNSLDACRCQIAKDNANGKQSKGVIEFGIGEDEAGRYMYCLDNGKGMSKAIIENYLLKIGNSYYQSQDFYQSQAETGFQFAPTSQFGIGILSCFIVGDRIEIVTKEEDGEHIACSIDGVCEYFYYKNPAKEDKEQIRDSGTLVKVYLKKECYQELNTKEIGHIDVVSFEFHGFGQKYHPEIERDKANWKNSLYKIVDKYVALTPDQIEVYVKWENGKKQQLRIKPHIYRLEDLQDSDLEIIDEQINLYRTVCDYPLKDYMGLVECYVFDIRYEGIQYKTIMRLPKPGLENFGCDVMKHVPTVFSTGTCVDGVVTNANFGLYSFTEKLSKYGIVNFSGENRPQLSVDRTSIIKDTDEDKYEWISKEIVRRVIEQAIRTAHAHIQKYAITKGCELYNMVWRSVFYNFNYSSSMLIEELSKSQYSNVEWANLSLFVDSKLSIGEFFNKDEVKIANYDYRKLDYVSQIILLNKLYSAAEIEADGNSIYIRSKSNIGEVLSYSQAEELERIMYLARTNKYGYTFAEYDIISNLYPIIPAYLYDLFRMHGMQETLNDHFRRTTNISNGLCAFFEQNPTEIDEKLGMYLEENDVFGRRREKSIRDLHKKRGTLGLFELVQPNEDEHTQDNPYRYAITAYIAPRVLTEKQQQELDEYKESNPSYYKGVTEGWSIIVLHEPDEKLNTIIKAGKCTREELVRLIPDVFWEKYKEHVHVFPNGRMLKEYLEGKE